MPLLLNARQDVATARLSSCLSIVFVCIIIVCYWAIGQIMISKKTISASVITVLLAGIAVQGFGTAEARAYGYVQAECPTIVQRAIDMVSAQCGKTGRGKLCYGNSNITAQFQPGATNIKFQAPGDSVDVSLLKQFTLSGMDATANTWGVAEMKIKADLPDADPTRAVTMILFGNIQMTDGTHDSSISSAVATIPAAPAMPTLPAMIQTAMANPIALTAMAGAGGGINPQATKSAGQNPGAGSKTTFSPMQAFYFQAKDSAPCDSAPHDGILIQSPQQTGTRRVTMVIDGATLSLGSTVYLTAQPGKTLTVNTLEGSVDVTAGGSRQTVPAGLSVQVPLDANLRANGAPSNPQFFAVDSVRALPTQILPANKLVFASGVPSTVKFESWTAAGSNGCSVAGVAKGNSFNNIVTIGYNDTTLWIDKYIATRASDGTYTATLVQDPPVNYAFTIVGPDKITGTGTLDLTSIGMAEKCDLSVVLTRNGANATP